MAELFTAVRHPNPQNIVLMTTKPAQQCANAAEPQLTKPRPRGAYSQPLGAEGAVRSASAAKAIGKPESDGTFAT